MPTHLSNTDLLEGALCLRLVDLERGAVHQQPSSLNLGTRLCNVSNHGAYMKGRFEST